LDADDWLRAILRELEPFNCEGRDKVLLATHQLTGIALAWWENYCGAAKNTSAITWDEFVEEFHCYHIPEATLKRKADEFRKLRQGNKSVKEYMYQLKELARYAPEEVDKDSKKQEMFKKGLTPELRTLLTPQIYPDFNTLMNMAILTEKARAEEKKENKRKFMEHKAQQQERSQRQRSFGHPMSRFQAPVQYRTQSQATGSQGPRT
jgi:predicted PolB exonuclease-like 3'-5' exonuclease